ncbi:MAG: hypothetical protein N4A35_16505 [Flavobacteriales bacterium]|nr:hypothetical protein [Flavobacteriales bacterium]
MNFAFLWEIQQPFIILSATLSILIPIGLFLLLIFKADNIVQLLKLDKGFDTKTINLGNLDAKTILKISILILGGLLLIDNLPLFLKSILSALEIRTHGGNPPKHFNFNWLVTFLKTVIGYLFITYYDHIARQLLKTKNID